MNNIVQGQVSKSFLPSFKKSTYSAARPAGLTAASVAQALTLGQAGLIQRHAIGDTQDTYFVGHPLQGTRLI